MFSSTASSICHYVSVVQTEGCVAEATEATWVVHKRNQTALGAYQTGDVSMKSSY